MTTTITYGSRTYFNDMDNATEWGAEHLTNMVGADASISSDGDILTMTGLTDEVGAQEWFYHELAITNFSNVNEPNLTVRFKTSVASGGMQAQVAVVFFDDSVSYHILGYSTTWKVSTVTPTSGTSNVIKAIRIYCHESAAANANSTPNYYYVYYDWYMFHRGTFTFPHVAPGGVQVNLPVKVAVIPIPGRNGDILQKMGQASFEITVRGDFLGGPDTAGGETWRNAITDPPANIIKPEFSYLLISLAWDVWEYFTCDRPLIRCQVMYTGLTYETSGENMKMQWVMHFLGYKLGDYNTFPDYEWIWGTA